MWSQTKPTTTSSTGEMSTDIEKSLDLTNYINYLKELFNHEINLNTSSSTNESTTLMKNIHNYSSQSHTYLNENSSNSSESTVSSLSSVRHSPPGSPIHINGLNQRMDNGNGSDSSLSPSDDDYSEENTCMDPSELLQISDQELNALLKYHEKWKQSALPAGCPEDVKALLQIRPLSNSNKPNNKRKHSSTQIDGKKAKLTKEKKHMKGGKPGKEISIKEEVKEESNSLSSTILAVSTVVPSSGSLDIPSSGAPKMSTSNDFIRSIPPLPPKEFMDDYDDEEESNDSLSDFVTMTETAATASAPTISSLLLHKKKSPTQASLLGFEAKRETGIKKKALGKEDLKQIKALELLNSKRRKIYTLIAKKEIPKTQRGRVNTQKELLVSRRKLASAVQRHMRAKALASVRVMKESVWRAKRLTREMQSYWKASDRIEREVRRKREREVEEQRKLDLELMEARRGQRKLNFLITQTELYAHFMAKKLGWGSNEEDEGRILEQLNEEEEPRLANDDYDSESMKQTAKSNVERAYKAQVKSVVTFDAGSAPIKEGEVRDTSDGEYPQPKLFEGLLKHYQLKGMNWLINLYDQGINGILADEMGLGKTVQSIAFFAHLAERYGLWGPILIIAPASTLHNWQQEFKKFLPSFKIAPYWGTTQERKILRSFWTQSNLQSKEASFHVVVTSYQIVVADLKYFNRIKWLYLILDEAQAIKSSSSARWRMLIGFNCRNRLLLTGTPIQNTMAELWALLHFIMPSLFDSHEEFNDWFSNFIESHAENKSIIDEKHLSRLHLILKPFMLRRIKKDVENELSDKIEILKYCELTARQRLLYSVLKKKIKIEDLVKSANSSNSALVQHATTNLMNLVMQFRKVCNHSEIFERREVRSPFQLQPNSPVVELPKLLFRDGILHLSIPSKRHLLERILSVFDPSNLKRRHGFSSFLRFMDLSSSELNQSIYGGVLERLILIGKLQRILQRVCHQREWAQEERKTGNWLERTDFLINLNDPLSFARIRNNSQYFNDLVFTSQTSTFYTFTNHRIHRLTRRNPSPLIEEISVEDRLNQPTFMPPFLYHTTPNASNAPRKMYFSDRSGAWWVQSHEKCGSEKGSNMILHGREEGRETLHFTREIRGGLNGIEPHFGWSRIIIPDKEKLVTDSGKLLVLDGLLKTLKRNGHRVLIYSQMTKMIDLLEEYMCHRKWSYIRLDGSSKIAQRRDMVADFQSRQDLFVFLLSTRAGGLGINLTAADTVIFYDSDWNPTVDQQAMDRAHRLGQTKQVTVYRLVCKGTIEEKILQRAKEKNEIQKMVISGGAFRPDTLKPREVVSLLLDDEELERRYRQKQAEKKVYGGEKRKNLKRKIEAAQALEKAKNVKTELLESPANAPEGPNEESQPSSAFTSDTEDSLLSRGNGGEELGIEHSLDFSSGFDECGLKLSGRGPRVLGRGSGKRGRPPSRVRIHLREPSLGSPSRRGPGRPRLRPMGPLNQGIRGRKPGRPPLSRKAEIGIFTNPGATSSAIKEGQGQEGVPRDLPEFLPNEINPSISSEAFNSPMDL